MRVLFDENVPDSLRHSLIHHELALTVEIGWARLRNGLLLRAAEEAGFDVLVTADQNIKYQPERSENCDGRAGIESVALRPKTFERDRLCRRWIGRRRLYLYRNPVAAQIETTSTLNERTNPNAT